MRTEFFIFFFAYFVLILFVSLFFSRRMKSLEDFFLASRKLPAFLVFLSISASFFGATSTLVSVDEAFDKGLSSFWVMGVPAILTVLVFAFILARPIRRLHIISLPDLVELRYGRIVRHLSSVLIVWYMTVLAASQMVALGNFIKAFLGTSYFISLLFGTVVVLCYSVFGGFFSVTVTDGIQFFLLVAGTVALLVFLWEPSILRHISLCASEIQKRGYFDFFFNIKRNLLIVVSFTLAWIISPIVWQRIQSARSLKKARYGLFAASGTFVVLYGILVLIGMFSLPMIFSLDRSQPLLSELISSKTGIILGGILFVAVVSAIMSTMDSAINTGALSLNRDIYQQLFSRKEKKEVLISRLSTILIGAAGFLIATRIQSILKTLGLASEIMTEGLFIPGIVMIFSKKKIPFAGFSSLVLGGGFALTGFLCQTGVFPLKWPSWPYSVPYGLGLSLLGFVIGFGIDTVKNKSSR
ncbi:MAG: sodium:solute symporter family protein [Candidatus Aminicenantaceae bacterium]